MTDHERYNRTRRDRYASDPEYRKRRVLASRAYRARIAAEGPPEYPPEYGSVAGASVRLRRTAEANRIIGGSTSTIESWLMRGTIPQPPFERPRRFTDHQVELLRQLYEARDSDPAVRNHVLKMLWKNWAKGFDFQFGGFKTDSNGKQS